MPCAHFAIGESLREAIVAYHNNYATTYNRTGISGTVEIQLFTSAVTAMATTRVVVAAAGNEQETLQPAGASASRAALACRQRKNKQRPVRTKTPGGDTAGAPKKHEGW